MNYFDSQTLRRFPVGMDNGALLCRGCKAGIGMSSGARVPDAPLLAKPVDHIDALILDLILQPLPEILTIYRLRYVCEDGIRLKQAIFNSP